MQAPWPERFVDELRGRQLRQTEALCFVITDHQPPELGATRRPVDVIERHLPHRPLQRLGLLDVDSSAQNFGARRWIGLSATTV